MASMTQDQSSLIASGADSIRARFGRDLPKTAIMLGSGLGRFAASLDSATSMPYGEIPGFSRSTVVGHSGNLIVGKAGKGAVAVMQGRIHAYEGHGPQAIAVPIRILRQLGVEVIVLTNASGGLRTDMKPGTLMIIEDHINMSGFNPLVGPNDDSIGPRFPDMSDAYDPQLRELLLQAARKEGVPVKSGVYLFVLGPNFETAAEVRMYGKLGADAVGMSTVPECLVARHCGMRVAGVSVVTNHATGIATRPLSHQETLSEAQLAAEKLESLLRAFLHTI